VNNSFVNESLQSAVDSYPVKMCPAHFFYITVRKCVAAFLKELKDLQPVFGDAELAVF